MTDGTIADFDPDSPLVSAIHPSPNINERRNAARPSMLILHYTGLPTVERSIQVLADPACQVSCHYVVGEAGEVFQMVPEHMRAWHAGVSYWQGHTDLNSMSISIEIQNPGHDGGYPDFPEPQMQTVTALARDIVDRHGIRGEHVLAHSDIAPSRKNDPGEKFDWRRLWQAGVGHWVEPVAPDATPLPAGPDAIGKDRIIAFQNRLRDYGYASPTDGCLDADATKVVVAFQRHFRPQRTDGVIDLSTIETLTRLLRARDSG